VGSSQYAKVTVVRQADCTTFTAPVGRCLEFDPGRTAGGGGEGGCGRGGGGGSGCFLLDFCLFCERGRVFLSFLNLLPAISFPSSASH